MKEPFQLTPEPESRGEAFRRIAAEHGYTIGADGKMTDSQFHPEPWPDGQTKEWVKPEKPAVAIHIIVAVSYDWFRFQSNIGASTDINEARDIAQRESLKGSRPLPVIEGDFDSASKPLDRDETNHIWIQTIE